MLKWPFYSLPNYRFLWKKKGFFFIMMTLNQLQLSNKTDVGQQKWRKVHWIDSKGNNCKTIWYSGTLSQCRNANSFNADPPLPSPRHNLLRNVGTVEFYLLAPGRHRCHACCCDAQNFNAALSEEETNTVILIMMLPCPSLPSFSSPFSFPAVKLNTCKWRKAVFLFHFPLSSWVYPIYYIEYLFTV